MVGRGRAPARVITVLVPPGSLAPGAHIPLDDDTVHHVRVRRGAAGERARALDGAGSVAEGTLATSHGSAVFVAETVERRPRPATLVVGVGAGDRERFLWLVEKLTELGATAIVPLETDRSLTVATRLRAGQEERLRRRAREALKQCGAAWMPEVAPPMALAAFAAGHADGQRWLADAAGAGPPAALGAGPVAIAVGPEGGFTDGERGALLAAGWTPCRLGPATLRFETAAVAAAAVVAAARLREGTP